jgi:hypothetical protein
MNPFFLFLVFFSISQSVVFAGEGNDGNSGPPPKKDIVTVDRTVGIESKLLGQGKGFDG